jgi:competence protein ComEA
VIKEQIQERLKGLDRREAIGLALVAVLLVTGAAFWYVRSLPSRVEIAASLPAPGPLAAPQPGPSSSASAPPAPAIYVHVAGRVRHPGVYAFHDGDRVIDAIRRAGGARTHADLRSINLAALLTDGEQIVLARRTPGGQVPAASGTSSGGGSGGATGTGTGGSGALVNLNTATLDELEALPGIGPVLGQRIVDYRDQHGPFGVIEDLMNVSGIGDQRFADLKLYITV